MMEQDAAPAGVGNATHALGRRRGSARRHYDLPRGARWSRSRVATREARPGRRKTPRWSAERRPRSPKRGRGKL